MKSLIQKRFEDMSPTSYLQLERNEDSKCFVVSVYTDEVNDSIPPSLEFCSTGMGGGQSIETHTALSNFIKRNGTKVGSIDEAELSYAGGTVTLNLFLDGENDIHLSIYSKEIESKIKEELDKNIFKDTRIESITLSDENLEENWFNLLKSLYESMEIDNQKYPQNRKS